LNYIRIARLIGIPLSVGTILAFILYFGIDNIINSILLLSPDYIVFFIIAILFHIASQVFWGFRIYFLTYGRGKPVGLRNAIRAVIASLFASTITPGYVGGEPIRIKKLVDYGLNVGEATAITVGERGFDSIFFGFFFFILLLDGFFYSSLKLYLIAGGIVIAAFFAIILLSISGKKHLNIIVGRIYGIVSKFTGKNHNEMKIQDEVENYSRVMKELFSKDPIIFSLSLISTFLLWSVDFYVPVILILGFGIKPDILFIILIQIILVLISLAPITPGASGIMEILMIATFTSVVGPKLILIFVIMWRFITFYFNIIFGSFYLHWVLKEKSDKS